MLLTKRSHAINLLPKTCCFEVKYLVNNWPITSLLRYYHAFSFRGKFGGKFNIPCGRFFISLKHLLKKTRSPSFKSVNFNKVLLTSFCYLKTLAHYTLLFFINNFNRTDYMLRTDCCSLGKIGYCSKQVLISFRLYDMTSVLCNLFLLSQGF